MKGYFLKNQEGATAIYMVLMILSGILIAGLGLGNLIIANIEMGGVQTQSTKAYFAAEAGAEYVLYRYRKHGENLPYGSNNSVASSTLSNNSSFNVSYEGYQEGDYDYNEFTSVGSFGEVRRSVEVSLRYYNP